MRIIQQSRAGLYLCGRRQEGEVGQSGLWLLWLAGAAMSAAGLAFALLVPDLGARVMGGAVAGAGLMTLLFGVFRSARRESLELSGAEQRLVYRLRTWPGPWRVDFEAPFKKVSDIHVLEKLESPGGGRHEKSIGYMTFESRLRVRPRKIITLDKSPDEARIRAMADVVAQQLGISVSD